MRLHISTRSTKAHANRNQFCVIKTQKGRSGCGACRMANIHSTLESVIKKHPKAPGCFYIFSSRQGYFLSLDSCLTSIPSSFRAFLIASSIASSFSVRSSIDLPFTKKAGVPVTDCSLPTATSKVIFLFI